MVEKSEISKPLAETMRFRVGDYVSFAMGRTQRVRAIIVEDRGPIGVGGRRLYGLRFQMSAEYDQPQYTELSAAALQKEDKETITKKVRRPIKKRRPQSSSL